MRGVELASVGSGRNGEGAGGVAADRLSGQDPRGGQSS